MKGQIKYFIAGFLIGALFFRFVWSPEPEEVKRTVTIRETVEVEKLVIDTTLRTEAPKAVTAKASPEPATFDSVRTYTGSHRFELGWIDWSASTSGALDFLEVSPRFEIPVTTITRTTDTEVTRAAASRGLFAGASMGSDLSPGLGATLLFKKTLVSYELHPLTRTHRVGVAIKIF